MMKAIIPSPAPLVVSSIMSSGSVIHCVYGPAIGVRSNERINGTRITLMTQIITDKTSKDLRQSALSASSVFYESVH
jgi:hypothetical protein